MANHPLRVLVVDDEDAIRAVVAMLLEELGYDVAQVGDPIAATRELEHREVDVVVSDVGLPHMSGFDFAALLKRSRPEVAVVLMTALPTPHDAIRAHRLGTAAYLAKPLDIDALLAAVRSASSAAR
jgi:DNA-binding response OmpR family regulator